jgi:hypothetical protein
MRKDSLKKTNKAVATLSFTAFAIVSSPSTLDAQLNFQKLKSKKSQ